MEDVARLTLFGCKAGLAFQIVDDVLDMTVDSAQLGKTAGKDLATEKATWPAVLRHRTKPERRRAPDRRSLCGVGAVWQPRRWVEGGGALPGRADKLLSDTDALRSRHPHRPARLLRS